MKHDNSMRWSLYATTAHPPQYTTEEVFENSLEICARAEALGFYAIWLLEHHFTRYGLCGSPISMAAYLLGKTTRLRIGTAVSVVPLDHPIRLAEQVAMLDQLSKGRFLYGVGRGLFLKDFEIFGVDVDKNHKILEEWVDLMVAAWTTGKCSADSEFVKFPEVEVLPAPYTKPHPPLYAACTSPSRTEWAARHGLPMMIEYLNEDEEKVSQVELYREAALEEGNVPDGVDHVMSCIGYVGDKALDDNVRHHMVWWENEFLRASTLYAPESKIRKNYAYYHRKREAAVLRGDWRSEDRAERVLRLSPTGSAQLCIDRLAKSVEMTGIRHVAIGFEALGSQELVLESMQRFMEEVAPHVGGSSSDSASSPADDQYNERLVPRDAPLLPSE